MSQLMTKKDLLSWLGSLTSKYNLVAPTKIDNVVLFQRINQTKDILLDYTNTTLSPKEWLLPTSENLFCAENKDGQIELIQAVIEQETVIFGLRPCDTKGIAILDMPYLAEPIDTLYQQHREGTTLIGLSCLTACPECFCTSMGSAPNDSAYSDILLTQREQGYIVEVVTDKGRALLPKKLLSTTEVPPPPPSPPTVPTEDIIKKMYRTFDNSYWNRVADRCIHCNICAYVCPTCYCFDIRDYTDKAKIERVRSWESCQSPGFTRIAGNYDPRQNKGARLRQRFYHKLLYFPESFGVLHCVGCGRCVKACPVNIDIREIIQDIQKMEPSSEV